jgi:hypothetical protein
VILITNNWEMKLLEVTITIHPNPTKYLELYLMKYWKAILKVENMT